MIDELRADGLKAPIATTNLWGQNVLFSLACADRRRCHRRARLRRRGSPFRRPPVPAQSLSYGRGRPRSRQAALITEWSVPYPELDRFTTPLYMASIASLQGWDAPMLYNYSQVGIERPGLQEGQHRIDLWSTYYDPAVTGVMPAAALAFRRGHISPAQQRML